MLFSLTLVITVLINSGYYKAIVTDSYVPFIVLTIVAAFYMLIRHERVFGNNKLGALLPILLVAIFLSTLFNYNTSNLLSGGRVALTMICAYIFSRVIDIKDFSRFFCLMVKIVIVISVVFYFVEPTLSGLPTYLKYYDLGIVTQTVGGSRAHGIFWEPGVYASVIVISMLLEYYISKRSISFSGFVIYFAGIIISQSTAGLLLWGIVVVGLLWRRRSRTNVYQTMLFIVAIILVAVFYETIIEWLVKLNPDMFGKLVESESATTSTRLNGPIINLEVFAEKPLFGWGVTDSATEIFQKMSFVGSNKVVAQTSTSTQMMAAIGILGAFYSLAFIAPIFSRNKLSHLSIELKIILAICMLMIVNKEPHIYIVITWIIMFYINNPKSSINDEPKENTLNEKKINKL